MAKIRRETASVADCDVNVWRGGKGAPLLYLHGAGGAGAVMPFMVELAEAFDIWVPEHPGFGTSGDPDWLDNVHDLAYFYLDFLAANDLDGVHLVGNSLGGWIALELAVRSTARLKTLSAVGASGIHLKGVAKGDIFMWPPDELVRNSFHDQAVAEKLLEQVPTEEQSYMTARNWRTVALLAWNPRLHDPNLEKWLHRIDVPTHIIWAEADKILPVDYAHAYGKLIPGSKITIVPECGHLIHAEKPEEFARLVATFANGDPS